MSRPSRDLVVAGHRQITDEWWDLVLPNCEPFVSQVVLDEISQGDPDSARRRLAIDRTRGIAAPQICTPEELMVV